MLQRLVRDGATNPCMNPTSFFFCKVFPFFTISPPRLLVELVAPDNLFLCKVSFLSYQFCHFWWEPHVFAPESGVSATSKRWKVTFWSAAIAGDWWLETCAVTGAVVWKVGRPFQKRWLDLCIHLRWGLLFRMLSVVGRDSLIIQIVSTTVLPSMEGIHKYDQQTPIFERPWCAM